jgi:hypothetical protein
MIDGADCGARKSFGTNELNRQRVGVKLMLDASSERDCPLEPGHLSTTVLTNPLGFRRLGTSAQQERNPEWRAARGHISRTTTWRAQIDHFELNGWHCLPSLGPAG